MGPDGEDARIEALDDRVPAPVSGIDPALKLFIDEVVIPALLDRLSGPRRPDDPTKLDRHVDERVASA
jgi:hypothetical protein